MNCQGLNWRKWMFLVGHFSVRDSPLKELHQQHQFSGIKRVNKKAPQKGRDWTLGLSANQPRAFITLPPSPPLLPPAKPAHSISCSPLWDKRSLLCECAKVKHETSVMRVGGGPLSHWHYTEYHVNEWAVPSVSLLLFSCYSEIPFAWKWQLK